MNEDERQRLKQWVETWKRAGPMLEAIRWQEVHDYNYEENLHIVSDLLEMGYHFRQPRHASGLVEQQRLFKKLRR